MTGPLAIPKANAVAVSPRLRALLDHEFCLPLMGQVTAHPAFRTLEPGWTPPIADPLGQDPMESAGRQGLWRRIGLEFTPFAGQRTI